MLDNFFNMPEIFIKTILTIVLTGFLGAQRQKYEKPAGFKTHIFVGVGAMLTVMVGYYLYDSGFSLDITRMPAQVISGIGFLGAGTIFKSEDKISGLTTASTVWVSGSIGVAVGSGYYAGAFVTAGVLFILLELKDITRYFFKIRILKRRATKKISYTKVDYDEVKAIFKAHKVVLREEIHLMDQKFFVLTCNDKILMDYEFPKELALRGMVLRNCYAKINHDAFEGAKVGAFNKVVALIFFKDEAHVKQFVSNVDFKMKTGIAMIYDR